MKANEAPEKLYFGEFDKGGLAAYSTKESNDEIEYTRTDAFIEKAWKFIDDTFHGTSIEGWGGESVDVLMSDASVYKDDLFENFRKYMKGE